MSFPMEMAYIYVFRSTMEVETVIFVFLCRLLAGLSIFHQRERLVALEDPQRRISEEDPSPFPPILASAYSPATTMAASSSLSFRPFFSSVATDSKDVGFTPGNFVPSFVDFRVSTGLAKALIPKGKRLLCRNKFQLNCSVDRDMNVSTSAMVDGAADCVNEVELKEPSISTMLMNFENKFDPYDAMSTPLYQTATFKQPSATENGAYDYTRSGNPTRDALESLLAKLDKADRAFCFTSGMAALAAVAHLVGTGEEIVAGDDIYGGSDRLLSQTSEHK